MEGIRVQRGARNIPQDAALHTVGNRLVSVLNGDIREHNPETGDVRVPTLPAGWMDNLWLTEWTILYGDDTLYWAINDLEADTVYIVRYASGGGPEVLLSTENEGSETGLAIDAARCQVAIGVIGSAAPKGHDHPPDIRHEQGLRHGRRAAYGAAYPIVLDRSRGRITDFCVSLTDTNGSA